MKWSNDVVQKLEWNGEITNREAKEKIGEKIAKIAKDGDVIGVGSGSTSFLATQAIARRIKEESLNILAIPTSKELNMVCNYLGIPTTTLISCKPDWYYDGADEVDPHGWLIKGRGGAMFNEKLIMRNCKKRYILVDDSKIVSKICEKFPIPVECTLDSIYYVKERLLEMGAKTVVLRLAKGKDGPIITENGNVILDAVFEEVAETLEKEIKCITGVLESGLFIGYNVEVIN